MARLNKQDILKLLRGELNASQEKEMLQKMEKYPELFRLLEAVCAEENRVGETLWQIVEKSRPLPQEDSLFWNYLNRPDEEWAEAKKAVDAFSPRFYQKLEELSQVPNTPDGALKSLASLEAPSWVEEALLAELCPVDLSYEFDEEGSEILKDVKSGKILRKVRATLLPVYRGVRAAQWEGTTYDLPNDLGEVICTRNGQRLDLSFLLRGKLGKSSNSRLLLKPRRGEVYSAPIQDGTAVFKNVEVNFYQVYFQQDRLDTFLFRLSTQDLGKVQKLGLFSMQSMVGSTPLEATCNRGSDTAVSEEVREKTFALEEGSEVRLQFFPDRLQIHLPPLQELRVSLYYECVPCQLLERRGQSLIFPCAGLRSDATIEVLYHPEKRLLMLRIQKGE
jgi:hypothetical protein